MTICNKCGGNKETCDCAEIVNCIWCGNKAQVSADDSRGLVDLHGNIVLSHREFLQKLIDGEIKNKRCQWCDSYQVTYKGKSYCYVPFKGYCEQIPSETRTNFNERTDKFRRSLT